MGTTTESWHEVPPQDVPEEGRVRSVTVGGRSIALTRCGGRLGALENRCPHQGGPLGEGSIEDGLLHCPWHGYDYDPISGAPPGGLADHLDDRVAAYEVEEGPGGVQIRLPDRVAPGRTVADVLVETLVAHGVDTVFGMVGHSNLGFADALRRAEQRGELRFIGIGHEGAAAFAASAYGKLTGRPAACFAIAGPGSTNLLTGLYDAKLDSAPVVAISGQVSGRFCNACRRTAAARSVRRHAVGVMGAKPSRDQEGRQEMLGDCADVRTSLPCEQMRLLTTGADLGRPPVRPP